MNITLQGVRTNELKNIECRIPHQACTVVIGPSGSGKSSLVMDTIYAEAKRIFIEGMNLPHSSLYSYRAELDRIEGLLPCLALDSRQDHHHVATQLGDLSEIFLWFRQLFSFHGSWVCPTCDRSLKVEHAKALIEKILRDFIGQRVRFVVVPHENLSSFELKQKFLSLGFVRVWQNQSEVDLQDWDEQGDFELIMDRLKIQEQDEDRLFEVIQNAWKISSILKVYGEKYFAVFANEAYCFEHQFMGYTVKPFFWNNKHPLALCKSCLGKGMDCSICDSTGLDNRLLNYKYKGLNWAHWRQLTVQEFKGQLSVFHQQTVSDSERKMLHEILFRTDLLIELGLGYLELGRYVSELSIGEIQRAKLSSLLGQNLCGVCYLFDEISAGLHSRDLVQVLKQLSILKAKSNTLVLVDHHPAVLEIADHIIVLGPGAGEFGGEILFQGNLQDYKKWNHHFDEQSKILSYKSEGDICFKGLYGRNLKITEVYFQSGYINVVSGVSGAGKSTLVRDTIYPALLSYFDKSPSIPALPYQELSIFQIKSVDWVESGVYRGVKRSQVLTFLGMNDEIRNLYASLPESQVLGLKANSFSLNIKGGRCEHCKGDGVIQVDMGGLGVFEEECDHCIGQRFQKPILKVLFKGKSIGDLFGMSIGEAKEFFRNHPKLFRILENADDLGLGHLKLGRSCQHLSAGEMQRLRLSQNFAKEKLVPTLFLMDEPSRGLYVSDVQKLIHFLKRQCNQGHTVICVDHHPLFISAATQCVELGPAGGVAGGEIVNI